MTGKQLIDAAATEVESPDLLSNGANANISLSYLNDTLRDIILSYPFTWRILPDPAPVPAALAIYKYDVQPFTQGQTPPLDIYGIVLDDASLSTKVMKEILLNEYLKRWANIKYVPQDKPREYAKTGLTQFLVAPPPQSDGYIFQVYYSLEFIDVTDIDAAVADVPLRAIEAVKVGVMYRMYRFLHEYAAAEGMKAIFGDVRSGLLGKLVEEDKRAPNLSFLFQEAVFGAQPLSTEYWRDPFTRGV